MNRWKQLASESTGSEIAEAAFVLPLVFALLFGIVWFGRGFNIYATLNRAAHEGAQASAVEDCATCRPTVRNQSYIQLNVVNPLLNASHIDPTPATVTLQNNVLMNPGATPPEFGNVVTVTYPYNFRLNGIQCCPLQLAPINLGVTLTAQAQSRQEN